MWRIRHLWYDVMPRIKYTFFWHNIKRKKIRYYKNIIYKTSKFKLIIGLSILFVVEAFLVIFFFPPVTTIFKLGNINETIIDIGADSQLASIPKNAGTTSPTPIPLPADDGTVPVVNLFDIQPRSINAGDSMTASFTVTDSGGSHLSYVGLNHAPYSVSKCNTSKKSDCIWSAVATTNVPANLDSWASVLQDTPAKGTWWYSLETHDNKGNVGYKLSTTRLIVNAAPISTAKLTPTPSTTPSPGPSATLMLTPTLTPVPNSTPTPTPTSSPAVSGSSAPMPSTTPSYTSTPAPTPSLTPIPTPSSTSISTPTVIPTPIPTKTPTPTPSTIVSASPAPTPTTTPTLTPTPTTIISNNFGMSVGETFLSLSSTELNARLSDMASLGITWLRFDISWNSIQSSGASTFHWSVIDSLVAAANTHNIKLLPVLDDTPAWARSVSCSSFLWCPPADDSAFAAFAAAAVQRYAPQGIHNWEIWNEPNSTSFWSSGADSLEYTNLLKAVYPAIKNKDSSAVVISGGMAPSATGGGNIAPVNYLNQMYQNGARPYFDQVGFHPYSYPVKPSYSASWNAWSQMSLTSMSLRSIMITNGDSAKQIWMTEFGAPTGGPGALATATNYNLDASPDHVTEELQSLIIGDAINLVRTYSWAGPIFFYSYKDLGTSSSTNENFFGVLRYDGSQKPAYQTIKQMLVQ